MTEREEIDEEDLATLVGRSTVRSAPTSHWRRCSRGAIADCPATRPPCRLIRHIDMLSPRHRGVVAATVPAPRAHGRAITEVFYRDMLAAPPELLDFFDPVSQRKGSQAANLATSVLAYVAHIADPAPLGGMVECIAHKHVGPQVRPQQYPIVRHYLLGAIETVLGNAATPENHGSGHDTERPVGFSAAPPCFRTRPRFVSPQWRPGSADSADCDIHRGPSHA